MRLFAAVEIDEQQAARAEALIRELRTRADRSAPGARVTWLTLERLHLTITFIGEVDASLGAAVASSLKPAVRIAPFTLRLGGLGAFPARGRPRALWVGVEEGRDELVALEREVTARLSRLGIPHEDRPYTPHLTLARVREASGLRTSLLLNGLERAGRLGATRIGAITLFESRLGPGGPRYAPIIKTPLLDD